MNLSSKIKSYIKSEFPLNPVQEDLIYKIRQ